MRPILPVAAALAALAALAAACGDVKQRDDCRISSNCPMGEYCARTTEGNVCWPDAVPPSVGSVTVACGAAGCPRDGTLVVTATATDDVEVLGVEATVEMDPGVVFPLVRGTGSSWTGTIDLASVVFPAFSSAVVVTVRVRDGARNEASAAAAAGQRPVVTRVRWAKELYTSLVTPTPPAVAADGTVVVGGSDGKVRFFGADGEPSQVPLALAAGAIAHAPSIGAQAIWVGANDGKLYAVALDGSAEISSRTCAASGVAKGPPAVLTTGGVDVAFGAFSNGRIAASTASSCSQTPVRDPYSSGAAVDASGGIVGLTANAGAASLRRFSWDGGAFEELWTASVGATVSVTPAFDASGHILSASEDAGLDLTTTAGATASLATLAGSINDSPIILSNGDIVVGDASGLLHRITFDGAAVTGFPVDLGAGLHAPMALTDGPVRFLVATEDGKVHALDDAGTILWSGALTTGTALGAGNIHTSMDCAVTTPCISTAYFGGADGRLYAVVVEGRLDTTAPWPKAWHDARNTSRAGGAF